MIFRGFSMLDHRQKHRDNIPDRFGYRPTPLLWQASVNPNIRVGESLYFFALSLTTFDFVSSSSDSQITNVPICYRIGVEYVVFYLLFVFVKQHWLEITENHFEQMLFGRQASVSLARPFHKTQKHFKSGAARVSGRPVDCSVDGQWMAVKTGDSVLVEGK